ncbi:MAG: hypothetical protein RB191_08150 [Terriglobia bacterium]|nr:hypothetical protein [Terriglobia bacterium]
MNIVRYEGTREKPTLFVYGRKVEALGLIAQRAHRDPVRELCFRLGRPWRRHFRDWEAGTAEFLIAFAPNPGAVRDTGPLAVHALDAAALRVELAKVCLSQQGQPSSWLHRLTPEATNVVALTLYQNAVQPAGHA